MGQWIALFRGINVGGNNIIRMADLRRDMETLGFRNVRTYIQSGNAVFEADDESASSLAERIGGKIESEHGFRPRLFVIDEEALRAAAASNPFPDAVSAPKTLHLAFLAEVALDPDTEALEKARSATESYVLTDRVFYLHAPDGIGRSKLAASAERYLGVAMTGRNYRTVEKLIAMVSDDPA